MLERGFEDFRVVEFSLFDHDDAQIVMRFMIARVQFQDLRVRLLRVIHAFQDHVGATGHHLALHVGGVFLESGFQPCDHFPRIGHLAGPFGLDAHEPVDGAPLQKAVGPNRQDDHNQADRDRRTPGTPRLPGLLGARRWPAGGSKGFEPVHDAQQALLVRGFQAFIILWFQPALCQFDVEFLKRLEEDLSLDGQVGPFLILLGFPADHLGCGRVPPPKGRRNRGNDPDEDRETDKKEDRRHEGFPEMFIA